jgi:fatty-acyl-CoA synthase
MAQAVTTPPQPDGVDVAGAEPKHLNGFDHPEINGLGYREKPMSETINEDQSGGRRGKLSLFALAFSVFGVVWFAAAALGSKYGIWDWNFGLRKMTIGWGPFVAFGALGLSALSFILALVKAPRKRPLMLAIGALLVSGLLAGRLAGLAASGQAVPPIHDIQTDWDDAVVFSDALMAARGPDSNPVRYGADAFLDTAQSKRFGGQLIADIQEAAECTSHDEDVCEDSETPKPYKPIEPLLIDAPRQQVFEAAQRIVEQRGWEIVSSDKDAGVLEATYTSGWWGFKDDVAIRIREAEGNTTRIDMRSVSRVGMSDLGANARRISAFLYELDGQRYD